MLGFPLSFTESRGTRQNCKGKKKKKLWVPAHVSAGRKMSSPATLNVRAPVPVKNSHLLMGTQEMLLGPRASGSPSDRDDISPGPGQLAMENL